MLLGVLFFFQAEDGIRDLVRSRGLGDVYKRQGQPSYWDNARFVRCAPLCCMAQMPQKTEKGGKLHLSLIHI